MGVWKACSSIAVLSSSVKGKKNPDALEILTLTYIYAILRFKANMTPIGS